MPRPGPRRTHIGLRFSPDGLATVRALAATETSGNLSAMIRTLLAEAVRARRNRTTTRTPRHSRTTR